MYKRILFTVSTYIYSLPVFAEAPCSGILPGCDQSSGGSTNTVINFFGDFIAELIQYVAIIAVVALMWGGVLYLVSGGEEEKTNKAKKIIIWALVGVFASIIAFYVINALNIDNLNTISL